MALFLNRDTDGRYELKLHEIVLSRYDGFNQALAHSLKLAKKYQKKIFVNSSCVSDWYIGFHKEKEKNPTLFYRQDWIISSELEIEPFKFVEGPFPSKEEAAKAAIKISGLPAVEEETNGP